jgi:hypothetical protein
MSPRKAHKPLPNQREKTHQTCENRTPDATSPNQPTQSIH